MKSLSTALAGRTFVVAPIIYTLLHLSAINGRAIAVSQTPPPQAKQRLPIVAVIGASAFVDRLVKGMSDIGYVAERDFHLEACASEGLADGEARCAASLVALQPTVIVATTNAALQVSQRTDRLPIVIAQTPENIALRMMDSLQHPGRNVTGVVERPALRTQRELSLLKELGPGLTRVAVLTGGYTLGDAARTSAVANGLQLDVVDFRSTNQLEAAFDRLAMKSPQALFVGGGPLTATNITRIARLAAARRWPSISENRELPANGGLMSYGGPGDPRRVALYVDKILKGAKPSDLPAEVGDQNWALVINAESAKRLGLAIPTSILSQSAEIIR